MIWFPQTADTGSEFNSPLNRGLLLVSIFWKLVLLLCAGFGHQVILLLPSPAENIIQLFIYVFIHSTGTECSLDVKQQKQR